VRMNSRMRRLLKKLKSLFPMRKSLVRGRFSRNSFVISRGCVFLKREYNPFHPSRKDFPDKTGYECSVNHVHLKFDRTRRTAKSCLEYCTDLDAGLVAFAPRRQFQIIASFSADGCVVRFHQIRPRESWLSDDLEGYKEESILTYKAGEILRN
jgi:hypothetical protein